MFSGIAVLEHFEVVVLGAMLSHALALVQGLRFRVPWLHFGACRGLCSRAPVLVGAVLSCALFLSRCYAFVCLGCAVVRPWAVLSYAQVSLWAMLSHALLRLVQPQRGDGKRCGS